MLPAARGARPRSTPAPARVLNSGLAREAEERAIWEKLAAESESKTVEIAARLAALQAAAEQAPKAESLEFIQRGEEASAKIDLDEAATRALIDQQLRDSGWEADTKSLRHASGARPAKGRNLAIAEWPTASGPADYALFVGLTLVGVVEAKRKRKNVSAAIDQAERYSNGIAASGDFAFAGRPVGQAQGAVRLRCQRPLLSEADRDRERHLVPRHAPCGEPPPRPGRTGRRPKGSRGSLEIDQDAATAALKEHAVRVRLSAPRLPARRDQGG